MRTKRQIKIYQLKYRKLHKKSLARKAKKYRILHQKEKRNLIEEMPKCKNKKHFSCKNCKRISRFIFKNSVMFCFGLIRRPNPKCDYFRFCIGREKIRNVTDIMIEEAILLLHGISTMVLKYLLNKKSK